MKSIKRMCGITIIHVLIIALVVVFASVIAIRLIPPYLDNFAIKDAMTGLASSSQTARLSKDKLKDALQRKMQTNYTKGISPDAIEIIKNGDSFILKMKYENRVHLIGNVDAVLMFDNEVPLSAK